MTRSFAATLVLAWMAFAIASESRAEITYGKADDGMTIVQMTVTPAAEPSPALKYRLMKREIDLKAGNATPYYYRALLLVTNRLKRLRNEFGEEPNGWYTTGPDAVPLAKLPLDKIKDWSTNNEITDELAEATSRRDCNWDLGIEDLRGPQTVAYRLHDFQDMRQLARLLALGTRVDIADKRYDDAIDNLQVVYRLAVDTAKVPFLVCGLIGIAEAGLANGMVTELIAQPNSPNLYWALTELPAPIVDMRPAARFELEFGPRLISFINHTETTDRSPEEWNRLFTQSVVDLSMLSNGGIVAKKGGVGAGLAATGLALIGYSHAKSRLIADGFDPAAVEAMSVGQVMAIYSERNYQTLANDYEKLWYVPFWEMRSRIDDLEKRIRDMRPDGGEIDREILPLADTLLPGISACRGAQVRTEREIAALRVIEALRMYAASHAGGLPKSLDEITEVPVPMNPATGKPFVYRLDGSTATIDLPKSDGPLSIRYEITIARPE